MKKLVIIFAGLAISFALHASASNPTATEKKICYSIDAENSTVTFIFDEATWSKTSVSSIYVRGSFNSWSSTANFQLTRQTAGFWSVTRTFNEIKQPGNSGQPEFKFYVNGSYLNAPSFVPEGYVFKNADNNQIIVFPTDNLAAIIANSNIANKIKMLSDFDLETTAGKEALSNFRRVPGTAHLYRSYHPFKVSKASVGNTEAKRLELVTEFATAVGVKSDICLSENETNNLVSYSISGLGTFKEAIPAYYQSIINNNNVLYVGQSTTVPSYNMVYVQSDGALFGNCVKEVVEFIISAAHPAPFLIHCRLGTDRTGVFCAVLEALLGVSWNDMAADFQASTNMGVREFRDYHLLKYSLEKMLAVDNLEDIPNLQAAVSEYFISNGYLTEAQIEAMDEKLNGKIENSISKTNSKALTVYPNPANQYVKIKSENTILNISIVALDGKIIQQSAYNNEYLYVGNINPGLYFIQIETTNTNKYIEKLMIVR